MNLTIDEKLVIETMRKFSPYANFKVEKRPSRENPNGELMRISVEKIINVHQEVSSYSQLPD